MKCFSWRGAVVAAVFASTAGMASAQSWSGPIIPDPVPDNDATQVTWSISPSDTYVLDYADLVKAQVSVLAPATTPAYPAMEGAEPVGITVYFPAFDTVRDGLSGLATAVGSLGGIQVTVPKIRGFATGGVLTLSNWSINAVTHQLNADIAGTLGLPSQSQVAVFTLGAPVVTGDSTSFSLWLTQAGADAFSQAVGLQGIGPNSLQGLRQYSFGTLSVDVAMVPEPSSYALALAGVVVALAARRSRRPEHQAVLA